MVSSSLLWRWGVIISGKYLPLDVYMPSPRPSGQTVFLEEQHSALDDLLNDLDGRLTVGEDSAHVNHDSTLVEESLSLL